MVQYLVSSAVRAFEFEVRRTEAIDKRRPPWFVLLAIGCLKSLVEQPFNKNLLGVPNECRIVVSFLKIVQPLYR